MRSSLSFVLFSMQLGFWHFSACTEFIAEKLGEWNTSKSIPIFKCIVGTDCLKVFWREPVGNESFLLYRPPVLVHFIYFENLGSDVFLQQSVSQPGHPHSPSPPSTRKVMAAILAAGVLPRSLLLLTGRGTTSPDMQTHQPGSCLRALRQPSGILSPPWWVPPHPELNCHLLGGAFPACLATSSPDLDLLLSTW